MSEFNSSLLFSALDLWKHGLASLPVDRKPTAEEVGAAFVASIAEHLGEDTIIAKSVVERAAELTAWYEDHRSND